MRQSVLPGHPAYTLDYDGFPAHMSSAIPNPTLLATPTERARLRICASETCGTRFFDRSPAGARRWCSMRTCGNEAKARRFRERERAPQ